MNLQRCGCPQRDRGGAIDVERQAEWPASGAAVRAGGMRTRSAMRRRTDDQAHVIVAVARKFSTILYR